MKTLFTTLIVLLLSSIALAQGSHTLTVTVTNAQSNTGKMMYSLSTKDQFMKSAPLMAESVSIKDGVAIAVFKNVPSGDYAVLVLHDLNENKRMDFDTKRMPTEAYGMSNNPMTYGPPTWQDAKFELTEDLTMEIRL